MPKKLSSRISLAVGLGVIPGLLFWWAHQPITFQSLESKTSVGDPVYNQIQFLAGLHTDTWIMRQSHHGPNHDKSQWDRLAIVVDKRARHAKFYQLESGELTANLENAQPLKVRCAACHASGPRAIRPSGQHNWITTALLNLRIKTYGALTSDAGVTFTQGSPFRSPLSALHRPLPLKTCERCHSDGGLRARLTLEQVGTARFLVEKGLMPPFPFTMSAEDRHKLAKF